MSDAKATADAVCAIPCKPDDRPAEFPAATAMRLLPVAAHVLSDVFTVTLPFVMAPLALTLGFVKEKHALVRELGAETVRATDPVKPPDGVSVTDDVPLLPRVTETLVAASVNDLLLLDDAETLMVSVPEEAVLTAELEGV